MQQNSAKVPKNDPQKNNSKSRNGDKYVINGKKFMNDYCFLIEDPFYVTVVTWFCAICSR